MICTIAFCLANLYTKLEITQPKYDSKYNEGYWCYDHWCEGPRADVEIGMIVALPDNWDVRYGFKHQSFIDEAHDKGQNIPFISITWRPFR